MMINLCLIGALAACSMSSGPRTPPPLTQAEQYRIKYPPKDFLAAVEEVLPESVAKLKQDEAIALKHGRSLTKTELYLANRVGVKHPERVRLYFTDTFPIKEEELKGRGSVLALTMNYGIFIKPSVKVDRQKYLEVIAHELAHVVQFETLGFDGMARRFLIEANMLDGKLIPIERDAIIAGNKAYDDPLTNYAFFKEH